MSFGIMPKTKCITKPLYIELQAKAIKKWYTYQNNCAHCHRVLYKNALLISGLYSIMQKERETGEEKYMRSRIEYFPLAGRSCLVCCPAQPGPLPVVVMPANAPMMAAVPAIMRRVENSNAKPFYLAVFETQSWQDDCTPWPAPPLKKGGAPFGGQGERTLEFIRGQLLPELERRFALVPGPQGRMLAGYSLAGLLALWAGLSGDDFSAVASCSGSLWYDGWAEFMQTHRAKAPLRVYLSLGSAEGKSHDARMQRVTANTRMAEWQCNQDPQVTRYSFKMHSGGHFKEVESRIAQALIWLNQ